MATSGGPATEEGQLPGAGVSGCQVATRFGWRRSAMLPASPGMVRWTHRIASIPLARVRLAFVTCREGVAHASAHASTRARRGSPALSSGAVSCSRQNNVAIVPGAAS